MKKKTIYTHEYEDGTTEEWLIEYKINKYYPETRYEPEQGGDIEIYSISTNGTEVDIEIDDKLYEKISDHIYDELPNDEPDYEF